MKPICRNIQNNLPYEFLGGNKFRNLLTGKEGEVDDEKAREVFRFSVEATMIINEYPEVENLINTLQLRFDNNKNETK